MVIAGSKVYVVVRVEVVWCGNPIGADENPLKAFSDREQAAAYLERCRRDVGDEEYDVFDLIEMDLHG